MSRTTSPGTGRVYGVERVCAIWDVPRSSFYAEQQRKVAEPTRPTARRRGPKPKISDEDLLAAILADLEASIFEGEGYRKVWARLRVQQGIRVSRTRVRVLMRDNNLLSPHRARARDGRPHDGTIITDAPNVMWGTDGVRVFTLEDGWGWIFPAVDHWNAECVAPQARQGQDMAATPSKVPSPLHADLGLLAQCRRGLLRQAHETAAETRCVPFHRRSPGRHQPLPRRAQPKSKTLRLDRRPRQNHRKGQPRETSVGVNPLVCRRTDLSFEVLAVFGTR